MLFYQRAVALDRKRHHKLRIEPLADHFSFASQTNAMLLASTEIADASRDYPIVFVGQEGGPFTLAALVGLRENENLLVDANGRWETNAYVPAFARRYPFVLAEGKDDAVLTVCVDETYGGLNEKKGEALFDDGGQESPYLTKIVEFLGAFNTDMQRTRAFAARLNELGLLVSKVMTVSDPGAGESGRQVLKGVWVVDEEKLRAIDDARVVEMFRNGYMGWMYAHLLSLRNVQKLAVRLNRARQPAKESAAETRPKKTASRSAVPRWNGSERRKNPR